MATSTTPQSQAAAAQAALNQFLAIAPRKYYSIIGTVATGSSGGAGTGGVSWQQQVPIIPAFCTAIDFLITLPLTVTVSGGGTANVSPFAPYSAFSMQLTLGGAPPWPMMELTPFYLDQFNQRVDFDPFYPGLGGGDIAPFINAGTTPSIATGILDFGPTPDSFTSGYLAGQQITASGTPTLQFKLRVQLQRKRHLLWGAIPMGDPENRPNMLMQLNPTVGTLPEQNLFINFNNTGVFTATTNGAATVKATYELAYIDLLPPGMTNPPQPAVGYGLQVVPSSPGGLVAGAIFPMTHRTAMIYTDIHHLLINNGLPIRADYFGLWDDQDQQSARWSYDGSANTLNDYWDNFHRTWRRYPLLGQYTADFDNGLFPEIPSVTPYDALMTPDQSYSTTFGIPVTPAFTTAIRIPTGTSLTSPYVRNYELGLVRVPY